MRARNLTDGQLAFLSMIAFGIAEWSAPTARDTARELAAQGLLRLRNRRGGPVACSLLAAGRAALREAGGIRPARVQLSRRRGFRLSPDAVKVDRSTPFGNPFRVAAGGADDPAARWHEHLACRDRFAAWLLSPEPDREPCELTERRAQLLAGIETLRGRDLACWCSLCGAHMRGRQLGDDCAACTPCHADVLLRIVNIGEAGKDAAGDLETPAASR
jgi:Domain of unknown function (DUF4326)